MLFFGRREVRRLRAALDAAEARAVRAERQNGALLTLLARDRPMPPFLCVPKTITPREVNHAPATIQFDQ